MPHPVPVFWSRWIILLSFLLMIYGLVMVFAPQFMNRTLVAPLLYSNNDSIRSIFTASDDATTKVLNVLSGLLGTVTTGWAVQMAWVAYRPFRNGERWAWNALATSVSIWAALEFYFKLSEGITGVGLFAHLGLLVAFATPLLATWRHFNPKSTLSESHSVPK